MSYFARLAAMVQGGRVPSDHGASIVEHHEMLEQHDVAPPRTPSDRPRAPQPRREVTAAREVPAPREVLARVSTPSPREPERAIASPAPIVIASETSPAPAASPLVIRERVIAQRPSAAAPAIVHEVVDVVNIAPPAASATPPRIVAPKPRERAVVRRDAPGLDTVAEVLRWVGEPVTAPPAPARHAEPEHLPSLEVSIGAIEIAIDAPPQPRVRTERAPAPARRSRVRDTQLARRLPRLPGGG